MNKTNVRRLAMALLTSELANKPKPVGYNQRTYFGVSSEWPDQGGHDCGTVACIAGHAALLNGYRPRGKTRSNNKVQEHADEFLGISLRTARQLYNFNPLGSADPTAKQAALVLFNLAETGKVDWEVARRL